MPPESWSVALAVRLERLGAGLVEAFGVWCVLVDERGGADVVGDAFAPVGDVVLPRGVTGGVVCGVGVVEDVVGRARPSAAMALGET